MRARLAPSWNANKKERCRSGKKQAKRIQKVGRGLYSTLVWTVMNYKYWILYHRVLLCCVWEPLVTISSGGDDSGFSWYVLEQFRPLMLVFYSSIKLSRWASRLNLWPSSNLAFMSRNKWFHKGEVSFWSEDTRSMYVLLVLFIMLISRINFLWHFMLNQKSQR